MSQAVDYRTLLNDALVKTKRMQAQLTAYEQAKHEPTPWASHNLDLGGARFYLGNTVLNRHRNLMTSHLGERAGG